MSTRWKWASPFKPSAAKPIQRKEGVSKGEPNGAPAPLSSLFARASVRNEPETRSRASRRSRSSSDVVQADVVQSTVHRSTPSLQVSSTGTPPTGSFSAACPSASMSTSTLKPASGSMNDGASRRKARLRSPRTGGPLRPFGGKPSAEMLDEVLGFTSPYDPVPHSPVDSVGQHASPTSRETTLATPTVGRVAVISLHRTASHVSFSSSTTSTSRGAGSSLTSLDQASASPRSTCSAATSSVPTTVDATSRRSSRVGGESTAGDVSGDFHLAFARFAPAQMPKSASGSDVRPRPPTPSGSVASRSLRKTFRMGSSPPSAFDLPPMMAPDDDQTHKPLRKPSISSLWSKLSISRKGSRASLRRAVPAPAAPLQLARSLSSVRSTQLSPVEERLSDKTRKSSSSSDQIARRDRAPEMMSFYEAAAADRLYPKQPSLSPSVRRARRHVSKDLPPRPPSERALPPRPLSGLSTASPTKRSFDVNLRPSRERLGDSLALPSSALSKKAKRRSVLSVKDLPPPAPPPTGPLPPTPAGPPAPSPLVAPADDDVVREPHAAVRDSLEDLYSSSNLFYGRDDADEAPLPEGRSLAAF